jgi:integrase
MGTAEVEKFLTYLATQLHVSSSTQNQALSAILFLYRDVLAITLPWLDNFERSKRTRRLPEVLTASEVQALLREAATAPAPINLIIKLLYGTGMRLMEAVRLRVKDVELTRFVCNSFTAKWLRYSYGAGVVRAFGCQYDHDLHSCVEQGWQRGVESLGSTLTGAYRVSLKPSNAI